MDLPPHASGDEFLELRLPFTKAYRDSHAIWNIFYSQESCICRALHRYVFPGDVLIHSSQQNVSRNRVLHICMDVLPYVFVNVYPLYNIYNNSYLVKDHCVSNSLLQPCTVQTNFLSFRLEWDAAVDRGRIDCWTSCIMTMGGKVGRDAVLNWVMPEISEVTRILLVWASYGWFTANEGGKLTIPEAGIWALVPSSVFT